MCDNSRLPDGLVIGVSIILVMEMKAGYTVINFSILLVVKRLFMKLLLLYLTQMKYRG